MGGENFGPVTGADDAAEHEDHLEDFVDRSLVEYHHAHAARDQLASDVGLEVREAEDEVGFEGEDFVELRGDEGGDLWLLAGFWRARRVAGNASDAVLLAEKIKCLGGFLGEADDAAGEGGGERAGCPAHR